MKSAADVECAKTRVCHGLTIEGLDAAQIALLRGMLVALNWVLESPHGSCVEELIGGREIVKRISGD